MLRLDLNVPLKQGKITDETRIDKIIPTIRFLLKEKSKILIISLWGVQMEKSINLSLKPICENLKKLIKIQLIKDDIFQLKKEDLFKDPDNQIVLENVDFIKKRKMI